MRRCEGGDNVGGGSTCISEDVYVYDEREKIVDSYLLELGANIIKEERILPYSLRYEIEYDKKRILSKQSIIECKSELVEQKIKLEKSSNRLFK